MDPIYIPTWDDCCKEVTLTEWKTVQRGQFIRPPCCPVALQKRKKERRSSKTVFHCGLSN